MSSMSGRPSPLESDPIIMGSAATTLPTTEEERMYSPAKLSCTVWPSDAMVAAWVALGNAASAGYPLIVTV